MNRPTFQQQYNKIVSAYYKNQLDPFEACACFIGNMLDNTAGWVHCRKLEFETDEDGMCDIRSIEYWLQGGGVVPRTILTLKPYFYTGIDIALMEDNFLRIYVLGGKTEDSLFEAMESTLIILKEIHKRNGELIKDYNFEKRNLEAVV